MDGGSAENAGAFFNLAKEASVKECPSGAIWPARDRPAGEKNPA